MNEKETWIIFNESLSWEASWALQECLRPIPKTTNHLDVKTRLHGYHLFVYLLGFISMFWLSISWKAEISLLYQEEMDDDDLNETYYVQMYRNLEFGTIANRL